MISELKERGQAVQIKNVGYDCYHAALTEICSFLGKDFEPCDLFFLNNSLNYRSNNSVSRHVGSFDYDILDMHKNLNKNVFHIMCMDTISEMQLNEEFEKGNCILLMLENSKLDYDPIYIDTCIKHHCIVAEGINMETHQVYITDPYILINSNTVRKYRGYIDSDKILDSINQVVVFEGKDIRKKDKKYILHCTYNTIDFYLHDDNLNSELTKYINNLRKLSIYDNNEFMNECIYAAFSLENISFIRIFKYLRDLASQYSIFNKDEIKEIENIINQWSNKKSQLQKIGLIGKSEMLDNFITSCMELKLKHDYLLQEIIDRNSDVLLEGGDE